MASIRAAQAGFLGQLQQELQGLVGDAVLRVVEVDAGGLGGQPLAALRIVGEQSAQVQCSRIVAWWASRAFQAAVR